MSETANDVTIGAPDDIPEDFRQIIEMALRRGFVFGVSACHGMRPSVAVHEKAVESSQRLLVEYKDMGTIDEKRVVQFYVDSDEWAIGRQKIGRMTIRPHRGTHA